MINAFFDGVDIETKRKDSITPKYHYKIDLTDTKYDRNKWYPVSAFAAFAEINHTLCRGLVMLGRSDSYNVPWGTNGKAIAHVLFDYSLSNWGNRSTSLGYILDKDALNGAQKPNAIGIRLPQLSNNLVLTLRGGAIYHLYLDYPATVKASSDDLALTGNEKFSVTDAPVKDPNITDLVDLLADIKSKLADKS